MRVTGFSGEIWKLCSSALALAMLTSCSAPEVSDSPPDAPTFVSLNPCLDAILVEVADPQQILALSHYSRAPRSTSMDAEQAKEFGVTGGTVEEVLALEPNVVLAGSFMAPATQGALANLGLDLVTFGIASDADTSTAQIRQIAKLAGHTQRGEALIARIETALERPMAGAQASAVLWQPGQIVPGRTALVSELMEAAGFTNHAADIGLNQADYLSLEQLLSDPPKVLLIAGDARAQNHDALGQLSATHIASFDPSLLYCAGPTIIRALDRMRQVRGELDAVTI